MALCGASYLGLTGVLILWARQWGAAFGLARGMLDPIQLATGAATLCAAAGVATLFGKRPDTRPRGTAICQQTRLAFAGHEHTMIRTGSRPGVTRVT